MNDKSLIVYLKPCASKQMLQLEILNTDTIAEIKRKIEAQYPQYPAGNINLLYQGRNVDDSAIVDFSRETLVTLTFRNNLPSPAPVPAVPRAPVERVYIYGAGEGICVSTRDKPKVEDIFADISTQTGKGLENAVLYSQMQVINRNELLKSFFIRDNEALILSETSTPPIPVAVTIPGVNAASTKKLFLEKNNFPCFVDRIQKIAEKFNGKAVWDVKDKQLVSVIEYRTKGGNNREYVNADLTFIPPFPLSSSEIVEITFPDIRNYFS